MLHKKILLVVLGILCSRCATILQGQYKEVMIVSTTPGTEIYIDGSYKGMDMVEANLKRNKNHRIIGKKKGYKEDSFYLKSRVQFEWFPFILHPLLFLTDFFYFKSTYTFNTDRIHLHLKKKKTAF